MRPLETLSHFLSETVRPDIHLGRVTLSSFQVCGYIGLVFAILLALVLVLFRDLSPWVMAGVILAAMATFLTLAMVTKIVTGRERLIYYHHEIAVIAVAAGLLWLLHQPILPYLDATILGVGVFLAGGRIGCLMVGCCHGRPHQWGVCYRDEHAAAGFTQCLVGVRLFPVQALESLLVLAIVLMGSALVLSKSSPGAALAWYVIAYGTGRFALEFLRGDAERPYFLGFSEAQWTSLLLMVGVLGAELSTALPLQVWHFVVTSVLVMIMIVVTIRRRLQQAPTHKLLHPYHIREVAELLDRLESPTSDVVIGRLSSVRPTDIRVGCTSLGINISVGVLSDAGGLIWHYALSAQDGSMNEEAAHCLTRLILQLRHPLNSAKFVSGAQGTFHLLVDPYSSGPV